MNMNNKILETIENSIKLTKRKSFFGHTWLGWLNLIILQWFFIRLAEELDLQNMHRKWTILRWVIPTTGWKSDYIFLGK